GTHLPGYSSQDRIMQLRILGMALAILAVLALGAPVMAQAGRGKGPGRDPAFAADRDLFHNLLVHRADIRREVKKTPKGGENPTESEKPEVNAARQEHVASMEKRVKDKKQIHLRDPLFAEVFRHADRITFVSEKTIKGVRVTETSNDP